MNGFWTCKFCVSLWMLLFSAVAWAQPANDNCANATVLCPNQTYPSGNVSATAEVGGADGATANGTFCFTVENTVWFTFTSNAAGGAVTVDINQINCLSSAGSNLSAVLIEANTPCDPATYTMISNCESSNPGPLALTAAALAPNTTYYVIVDGDTTGGVNPSECDFSLAVSGPAVDFTATATITDQNCGSTDGAITVDNVSGGVAPYQYSLDGGAFQASNQFSNLSAGTYTVTVQDANGCETQLSATVVEVGGPTSAVVNTQDAACVAAIGQIVVNNVTGGTAPYTYGLNGGTPQASNTFNALLAGTYAVTITDANGCAITVQGIVNNSNGPTGVTYSVTNGICGEADGIIDVTVPGGGTPPYSYSLNGGTPQASNVFAGLAAGSYIIIVTDANGCVYTLNNILVEDIPNSLDPTLTISAVPNPACDGDQVTVTATLTDGGSAYNLEWFVNGASVQSGQTATYSAVFTHGDMISVQYTSASPCVTNAVVNSNNLTLSVLPILTPGVTLVVDTTVICVGESANFTATVENCGGSANYTWNINGTPVVSGPSNTFSAGTLTTGDQVTVTAECSYPCATASSATSAPISITVINPLAMAGPDHEILLGDQVQLGGIASGGIVLWVPASGLDDPTSTTPNASPSETTVYTITVTDGNCTATDEAVVVVIQPLTPPNTFTPNGDGFNDFWEIERIDEFPNAQVTIYDRWGQKVFTSTGYNTPWDGTNRGLSLPVATYYWVIRLDQTDKDSRVASGSITIIK